MNVLATTGLTHGELITRDAAATMDTLRGWAREDDAMDMRLAPLVPRFYYCADTGTMSLTYGDVRVEFSGDNVGDRILVSALTGDGAAIVNVSATVYHDESPTVSTELYSYEDRGTVAYLLIQAFTGAYDESDD